MEIPDYVTEEHLEYLDGLRESGVTNMFGAAPFVQKKFYLELTEAKEIVGYWMDTFSDRHEA